MDRIGIFGGSFDPPHWGHFQAAQGAIAELGLEKLWMVPCSTAPHKAAKGCGATGAQRLEMLRCGVQMHPNIEISDIEIARGGISYSYETVLQVKSQYPDKELVLLVGSDMFLSFQNWKNPQIILENASLGVFCRGIPGEEAAIEQTKARMEAAGARIYLIHHPVVEISSTQLRRLLIFRGAGAFLPEKVEAFIRENGLYGTSTDYRDLPARQLQEVVVSLLKPNRVAHVLGCRDAAVELARRWGADPVDAERAALLHDITKALDGHLQLDLCRAYGVELDEFSLQYPKTLHALTGSLVAERVFGENKAVVDAICCHTTGKAAMNMLEIILYVADYMEPNRDFPGVEELRYLTTVDMKKALARGLEMTIAVLKRDGKDISPASQEALNDLGIYV